MFSNLGSATLGCVVNVGLSGSLPRAELCVLILAAREEASARSFRARLCYRGAMADQTTSAAQRFSRRAWGVLRSTLVVLAGLATLVFVVRALNPLPALEGRSVSVRVTGSEDTPLGRAAAAGVAAHPGLSGIRALRVGEDAFVARVALARAATRSLDLQYYIWKRDLSGTLLLQELRAAADRGVRVRLLLDDNVTAGLDPTLAALNGHRNIEIRLFNPFVMRRPRWLGYLTDFRRLNRRMHNKSFTADNQATIVGGRNIGDEYMGAHEALIFADLDVLAVGPVVDAVSRQFDRYWASRSSYPAEHILPAAPEGELDRLTADATRIASEPAGQRYVEAVRNSALFAQLTRRQVPFEPAPAQLVSDDPAKGLGLARRDDLLLSRLTGILGKPRTSLALVSSYFVPTKAGVEAFSAMAQKGVSVHIMTNAMEASDVPVVHAGYAPWRKTMLKAGITLYEMRHAGRGPRTGRNLVAGSGAGLGSGGATAVGGLGTALHAKTFAVDGQHSFVGSFNFDPRSARLNTELGMIIDSPLLSRQIDDAFGSFIPAGAYQVKLDQNGDLYWLEQRGTQTVRHNTEPGTTFFQRSLVGFLSLLPIDWLL
jgi:putative cardiolipin synthase